MGKENFTFIILRKFKQSTAPSNRNRFEGGFSFVEILIAMSILGTGVAGLSSAILELSKAREKAAIVSASLALESSVTTELANEDNFRDAGGNPINPATGNIKLNIVSSSTPAVTTAIAKNVTYYFANDLTPCAALGANCNLSVIFAFTQDGAGIWKAAYRITLNPTSGVQLGNIGAQGQGAFAASDYHTPLPDLVWKNANNIGCNPATDVAIMGFDRNTGAVTCLKKPSVVGACPAGKLPKSFVIDSTSVPGVSQLVLDCQVGGGVTAKTFSCPTNYRLQAIPDPRVFDPTYSGTSPVCVWQAQKVQVVGPGAGPAPSLAGIVCPRPASGTAYSNGGQNCILANGAQANGSCETIAGCISSMISFGAITPPTLSSTITADQISCSAVTGSYTAPACASAISPALWYGTVSYPARTCTLTLPEQVPAT